MAYTARALTMTIRIRGCYIPPERADHFAKRATPEEVLEAIENQDHPPLWAKTRARGGSPEYIVFGRTANGRYLLIPGVVFDNPPLVGLFMPWTVREMNDRERRYYQRNQRR